MQSRMSVSRCCCVEESTLIWMALGEYNEIFDPPYSMPESTQELSFNLNNYFTETAFRFNVLWFQLNETGTVSSAVATIPGQDSAFGDLDIRIRCLLRSESSQPVGGQSFNESDITTSATIWSTSDGAAWDGVLHTTPNFAAPLQECIDGGFFTAGDWVGIVFDGGSDASTGQVRTGEFAGVGDNGQYAVDVVFA